MHISLLDDAHRSPCLSLLVAVSPSPVCGINHGAVLDACAYTANRRAAISDMTALMTEDESTAAKLEKQDIK